METKQYKVYKFDELSKEAKEKAVGNLADINVDFPWWRFTYEEAEEVGVDILEFDCDRGTIGLDFVKGVCLDDVIDKIMKNHWEERSTYKAAKKWKEIIEKERETAIKEGIIETEDVFEDTPLYDDIVSCFKYAIGQCYLFMLTEEVEYAQSEKAIIETIKANDYNFLENGGLDPLP